MRKKEIAEIELIREKFGSWDDDDDCPDNDCRYNRPQQKIDKPTSERTTKKEPVRKRRSVTKSVVKSNMDTYDFLSCQPLDNDGRVLLLLMFMELLGERVKFSQLSDYIK